MHHTLLNFLLFLARAGAQGDDTPVTIARNVRVQFGPVVSATPVFRVERDVTVIVETP